MSLDWNTKNCDEDTPIRDKDGNLTPSAQTIIFMCMLVDMPEITEKNYKDFFDRVELYEHVLGPARLTPKGEPRYTTIDEVYQFRGLSTNVALKTRAAFETGLAKTLLTRKKQELAS